MTGKTPQISVIEKNIVTVSKYLGINNNRVYNNYATQQPSVYTARNVFTADGNLIPLL